MSSISSVPPSRIGIGSRLKIARFKLTIAIRPRKLDGPSCAASLDICAMPIGPANDFGETRRSTMLPNTWKIIVAFCRLKRSDSTKAGPKPSFTICTGIRNAMPIRHGNFGVVAVRRSHGNLAQLLVRASIRDPPVCRRI